MRVFSAAVTEIPDSERRNSLYTLKNVYYCRSLQAIQEKGGKMKGRVKSILVFAALFILLLSPLVKAAQKTEDLAVKAAGEWLALVDQGKYAESWDGAAQFFKGAVTAQQWKASVSGVRKPFGKLVSRSIRSKNYTTSLPGAPDGEYVVIQYDTSFENKKTAVETVTPMRDKDGKWRVSGYYIK